MPGRYSPDANLDNFMRDYYGATLPHPIAKRERVWVVSEPGAGDHYVVTELRPFDGQIHLSSILSVDRGSGYASLVLDKLCELADQRGVAIHLTAEPFGKDGLDKSALEVWYRKRGFENDDEYDADSMVRNPKREQS